MTDNRTDLIAAAERLTDESLERMRQLRDEINREDQSAAQRRAAKLAELGQLQARYQETEQQRAHDAQVATLRAEHDQARTEYNELASAADQAAIELDTAARAVTEAFSNAVRTELARRAAAPRYDGAARTLRSLGEHVPEPSIDPARYHNIADTDPLLGIRHTAVVSNPELEQQLDQLAGRHPGGPRVRFGGGHQFADR